MKERKAARSVLAHAIVCYIGSGMRTWTGAYLLVILKGLMIYLASTGSYIIMWVMVLWYDTYVTVVAYCNASKNERSSNLSCAKQGRQSWGGTAKRSINELITFIKLANGVSTSRPDFDPFYQFK